MSAQKTKAAGHLAAIFTMLIWGTTFISTKVLLEDLSPLEILVLRFVAGYIFLWIIRPVPLKAGSLKQEGIMIVFAVMDEDPDMNGYYTLTAAVERVIERFQRNQSLEAFWCSRRMNVAYQEDDTFPHFFAGIEMIWYIPEIEQEEMW